MAVAEARRAWRLIAVFALALAVIGMHSMGAGHHGTASPLSHGTPHVAAGSTDGSHDQHAMTGRDSRHEAADVRAAGAVATCHGCSTLGQDDLGALCLAVLSTLLGWVLLRALRHASRERVVLTIPRDLQVARVRRAPLRRMTMSPIEVCVLRT